MDQIKAVIIDDEPDNVKTLQLLIGKYCPDVTVQATFTDPKVAIKALPKTDYDLLFLDVEMPDMTGFELLKKLPKHPTGIIFVTAHSTYAVKAFKFNALDYLLKPVDVEELIMAVTKYKKSGDSIDTQSVKKLMANLEFLSKPTLSKLVLPTQDGVELITTEDIIFLKADRNYTQIKRFDKKDLIVAKTLGDFEEILVPPRFMRINKQYLINLDKVARYIRNTGNVIMCENTEIQISRTRKDEFLSFLKV
ncbi:MAG: DNA-binding response regulator [Bacteroidetes bacterium]|nr:DNA-binding response regulator [Bacteroidota bacterium]